MSREPMSALAYAKVNLALAVYPAAADGYHPLRGIYQSVSLADTVTISPASDDEINVSNDEAPADATNTAWIALDAVRRAARLPITSRLDIDKRIPAGSGLGGGSADAAAVIGLLAASYGIDDEVSDEIAISIGSDVPFALRGGTALVTGRGDTIATMEPLAGFAIAIVVPPFALGTPEVFREWDRLDNPVGDVVPDGNLPPALRGREPIRNDLYAAAVSVDPRIAEWRSELAGIWGSTVCMTGSGSALFSFFANIDEAASAASAVTMPTRASVGVGLVQRGWERTDVHE
jgi:4-diphosphocytidyl-2-C-methyl-D-erythritol kinase